MKKKKETDDFLEFDHWLSQREKFYNDLLNIFASPSEFVSGRDTKSRIRLRDSHLILNPVTSSQGLIHETTEDEWLYLKEIIYKSSRLLREIRKRFNHGRPHALQLIAFFELSEANRVREEDQDYEKTRRHQTAASKKAAAVRMSKAKAQERFILDTAALTKEKTIQGCARFVRRVMKARRMPTLSTRQITRYLEALEKRR